VHSESKPLDSALETLRSREWEPGNHRTKLEEQLMHEFNAKTASHRFGKHPVLLAALAVLLIGSVGFAATGGIGLVKDWLVKVYIDGEEIDAEITECYEDENGTTHMKLDLGAAGEAELQIVPDEDGQVATIDVTAGLTEDADGDGVVEFGIGMEESASESESDDE